MLLRDADNATFYSIIDQHIMWYNSERLTLMISSPSFVESHQSKDTSKEFDKDVFARMIHIFHETAINSLRTIGDT